MNTRPKLPLFNRGYKIFVVILLLAIMTAIGLPKIRQWLAEGVYLEQNDSQS